MALDKNTSPRPSTRVVRIDRFTHREGADQPPEVLLGIYRRDADGTTTEVRAAARGLPAIRALDLVMVLGIVAAAVRARHKEAPGWTLAGASSASNALSVSTTSSASSASSAGAICGKLE